MDFFGKYKSPFGYYNNANQIDSYGVNHSGFTTRDELEYQFARQQRENELMNQCKAQGITENFPQYGANFWGNSANNYGFGSSDIGNKLENINKPLKQTVQLVKISNDAKQVSQDAIFNRVLTRTLGEEGGYENRPYKIDAPTNMGIRQDTLDRFKTAHPELSAGYPNEVNNLTYQQVKQIARKDYFDKYRIGEIQSQPLQETIFDTFYNHSPYKPALWAQKAVNNNTNMKVKEDGVFGSETIGAINKLLPEEIIKVNNAILDQRRDDYEQELLLNTNSNYGKYSVGLPARFERFRLR